MDSPPQRKVWERSEIDHPIMILLWAICRFLLRQSSEVCCKYDFHFKSHIQVLTHIPKSYSQMATESLCPPKQTLLIGHHCLIKMMASAKSSICSKITSVRMREKKSESKKSLPRAEVFCNHRCARVKYSGKGERGTHYIKASMIF